jgi:hypothetical protein
MAEKFPNLRTLAEGCPRWMDPAHFARVRTVAAAVQRRTGAEAWIDTLRAEVVFGYRDAEGVPMTAWGTKLYRNPGRTVPCKFDPTYSRDGVYEPAEDDICRLLMQARVDPRIKERWRISRERMAEHDAAEARGRWAEEYTPEVVRLTERNRERREMGGHYRRSIAV